MKVPFVDSELYSKAIKHVTPSTIPSLQDDDDNDAVIQTNSRSTTIIPPFIGKVFSVYSGKRSKRVLISPQMVGHKLGEFIFSKKLGSSIHNSEHNRKKIAKMKRKITARKVRKTTSTAKKPAIKKAKKK